MLETYLDMSDDAPLAARIAVLSAAADLGVEGDSGKPITSLARSRCSDADRVALLELLERRGLAGGTRKDALIAAAHSGGPDALRHWMELAGAKAGDTYVWKGKGQTLLHIRVLAMRPGSDEVAAVADHLAAVELLRRAGESTEAKNQKKETPLTLWEKAKSAFSPAARRRLDKALGVERTGGATLADVLEDPALAFGVIGALLRDKQLKEPALTKLAKAALKGVDRDDRDAVERAILGALHELPLAGLDLGAIHALGWGWDEPVFRWLDKTVGDEHGGESEVLEVRSLVGVGALTGLESLTLGPDTYAGKVHDLAPIAGHKSLRRIGLPTRIDDPAPLFGLPALAAIVDSKGALSEDARAELAKRKVVIEIG